jgi:hypothetical protein
MSSYACFVKFTRLFDVDELSSMTMKPITFSSLWGTDKDVVDLAYEVPDRYVGLICSSVLLAYSLEAGANTNIIFIISRHNKYLSAHP